MTSGYASIKGSDQAKSKKATTKSSAKTKSPVDSVKERSPEMIGLIANVQLSAPEFAGDLLITIAESALVSANDWKKELLEDAFRLAGDCQQKMPQVAIGPYPMDTRAGYRAESCKLNLDTLSLRCRAVESMLRLDKPRALELFNEIGKPKLPTVDCDGGLVYDVSGFYKTAAKLANQAFILKETQRGEHVRFLKSLIDDISSPIQIAPIANLIRSMGLSREWREMLVTSLATAIAKVSGDDRSFSSSIHSVGDETARLIHVCAEQGTPPEDLMVSLRAYYVKHFTASRCADTIRAAGDTGPIPQVVKQFNAQVKELAEKNIAEIEAEDLKPSRIEGKADVHFYWQSAESQKLRNSFKQLRFGSGNKTLTRSEMETDEWKTRLSDFLRQLSDWAKPDEDSLEDYFHEKANLYESVMSSVLLIGPERERVAKDFVDFLCRFDEKRMPRIEWFWHAKNLIQGPLNQLGAESNSTLRAMLDASKSQVLYIYFQVWKTLSNQPAPKAGAASPAS